VPNGLRRWLLGIDDGFVGLAAGESQDGGQWGRRKRATDRVVYSGADRRGDGGGCVCDIAGGCAAAVSAT
jgi:hypothetical protein